MAGFVVAAIAVVAIVVLLTVNDGAFPAGLLPPIVIGAAVGTFAFAAYRLYRRSSL